MLLAEQQSRSEWPSQVTRMDPKIYLLFLLFSMIIGSSSHADLRLYLRKLQVARLWKSATGQSA